MSIRMLLAAAIGLATPSAVNASLIWTWNDGSGLSARAVITQLAPRHLELIVANTSTHMPADLANDTANQFLTGISFDAGPGVQILGGSARLAPDAQTVNFDRIPVQYGNGEDVSGEWGYSNVGQQVNLARNVITAMASHSTPFGGPNLDGPDHLNGPQGGLLATPLLLGLGGLGGICGAVIFTVSLSADCLLSQLLPGPVEFGSDAMFVSAHGAMQPAPEAGTLLLMGGGGIGLWLLRRHRRRAAAA